MQAHLTTDMIITLIVLGFAIFLFVSEWVRVDVVGIMMMVILPILGLVDGKDAFLGLSSNAVCSIMAVIIIGAGLDKTGIMNRVAGPIVKIAGNSEKRLLLLISGTAGVISGMMQNIAAAALFTPVTLRICKRIGIPASRILMPMGFCCITGGTLTLVGASPTILLNDLLVVGGKKLEPFGLFTQTPIGLTLLFSILLTFMFFGKYLLPSASGVEDKGITADLMQEYKLLENVFEVEVLNDLKKGTTLADLMLKERFLVTVVGIFRPSSGERIYTVKGSDKIQPGDHLAIIGGKRNVISMAKELGWKVKPSLDVFAESLSRMNAGMAEVIVSPRSELIGKTLKESKFKELFGLNPIAILRGNKVIFTTISYIPLQRGDTILLQGPWEKFHLLKNMPQPRIVSFATPLEGEIMKTHKAKLALIWFAVAISLVIFTKLRLAVALMAGALGMIITGVLTIDEAYRSIDWMTVFLLGGLIPLGIAFERTGTAAYIAQKVLSIVGKPSPMMLLTLVGILTSFFTLVISNVGATILLVPLCINMAVMAGTDPRMAALVVGISASNSFILPTHQVNAFVMRPGGYRAKDYMKAGIVVTIIFLTVELLMIHFFYGVK
ncbi:MAG: SLC13 family permease [Deltaproteobacteria bacterium]|nr:MAG: SLC13 family permease [Deltaproteobacteria bacterium]